MTDEQRTTASPVDATAVIDQIAEACREELESLWGDLSYARREALNGAWSIRCENLQYRIERLTRVAGPTPWECVQWDLLESGVYQRIHEGMGITVKPDMDRVAEGRARTTWRAEP